MRHPNLPWIEYTQTPVGISVGCAVCRVGASRLTPQGFYAFAQAHAGHQSAAPTHFGAGDLVAAATKAVGLTPCTPCEQRRMALNRMIPRAWPRRG